MGKQGSFGNAVKAIRTLLGLSQRELAKLSGISDAYISLLETGQAVPSRDTTERLAMALHANESEMILMSDEERIPGCREAREHNLRYARSLHAENELLNQLYRELLQCADLGQAVTCLTTTGLQWARAVLDEERIRKERSWASTGSTTSSDPSTGP